MADLDYLADADNQYPRSGSHHVSNDRWLGIGPEAKKVTYNPHARDADSDLRVQEGTPFERAISPRQRRALEAVHDMVGIPDARAVANVAHGRSDARTVAQTDSDLRDLARQGLVSRHSRMFPKDPHRTATYGITHAGREHLVGHPLANRHPSSTNDMVTAQAGLDEPYVPRSTPNAPDSFTRLPPQKAPEGIPIEKPHPLVTYPRAQHLTDGRASYLKGHPQYDDGELKASYDDVTADPATQRFISAAYMDLPYFDQAPEVDAAYSQFRREVDEQYDYLVNELGIRHEVVGYDPYPNVEAMIADVRDNGRLMTLATAATGSHADVSDAENDKLRAVHDAFGHAASGRGFDRHGEEAAYQSHAAMFSALAQRAALTEFRAQNATLIVNGERAPQKHALLPVEMGAIDFHVGGPEAKARRLRSVRYDPNAKDADKDRKVQEGTAYERLISGAPKAPKAPKEKPVDARGKHGADLLAATREAAHAGHLRKAKLKKAAGGQYWAVSADDSTPLNTTDEDQARRNLDELRAKAGLVMPAPKTTPKPPPHEMLRQAGHDQPHDPAAEFDPASLKPGVIHPSHPVSTKVLSAHPLVLSGSGRPDGRGTPDDPIDVQGDLDKAVKLIAQGKSVRLNQPDEVATLLDKLRTIVDDAKARGDKAPLYNLCLVSVPGTNLFCTESKGIPRVEMPQLAGQVPDGVPAAEYRVDKEGKPDKDNPNAEANISAAFVKALRSSGVKVETKKVKANHLRASQNELNGAKVSGMSGAIDKGVHLNGTVFVTRDGYIVDGHHRWAAEVVHKGEDGRIGDVEMDVDMIDMDIGAALDYALAFSEEMGIPPQDVGTNLREKKDWLGNKHYEVRSEHIDEHYGEAPSGLWLPWDAMPPIDLGAEVKAGGADRSRGNAEQLRRYWTHGEGAAKINWGTPGDFKRCVALVERHMPGRAEGYCANRHKEATGGWPGHAPAEEAINAAKKAGKSDLDDYADEWEGDQATQDILLAEDASMKEWLVANYPAEAKAINVGTIFDVAGWMRRLGRDAEGWFGRIYSDFGLRQQAKARAALSEIEPLLAAGADVPADPNAVGIAGKVSDFDIELPQVQTAIVSQVNRMTDVDAVLYARITDTLAEGEAKGESMPQLADRVRQVFATSKARAMAIARTEVTAAANSAQMEAARLNGAKTKTWIATHDERTRESHVLIDRHTVDIDDHYPVPLVVKGVPAAVVPMEYPGDPQAPPGLVVNCRCTQAYGYGLRYPGAVESDAWLKAHGQ